MLLFLLGSFTLIIGFVRTPSIQYYTGGVVIGLFMAALFFAYGNSIRQTRQMEEKLKKEQADAAASAPPAPSSS